jgi:hypothetical protein
MSQREVLIVSAHALSCSACRERLLTDSAAVFIGRALSAGEKEQLAGLKPGDFVTPELLARALGVKVDDVNTYRDHPVARLRHF